MAAVVGPAPVNVVAEPVDDLGDAGGWEATPWFATDDAGAAGEDAWWDLGTWDAGFWEPDWGDWGSSAADTWNPWADAGESWTDVWDSATADWEISTDDPDLIGVGGADALEGTDDGGQAGAIGACTGGDSPGDETVGEGLTSVSSEEPPASVSDTAPPDAGPAGSGKTDVAVSNQAAALGGDEEPFADAIEDDVDGIELVAGATHDAGGAPEAENVPREDSDACDLVGDGGVATPIEPPVDEGIVTEVTEEVFVIDAGIFAEGSPEDVSAAGDPVAEVFLRSFPAGDPVREASAAGEGRTTRGAEPSDVASGGDAVPPVSPPAFDVGLVRRSVNASALEAASAAATGRNPARARRSDPRRESTEAVVSRRAEPAGSVREALPTAIRSRNAGAMAAEAAADATIESPPDPGLARPVFHRLFVVLTGWPRRTA